MREKEFSAEADDGDGSLGSETEPGDEPELEAGDTRLTPHWTRGVLTTLLFVIMVAGWSGVVLNYATNELSGERNRSNGVVAVVVGAVATVLFLITLGTGWYWALRAVVADRRGPGKDETVRRQRYWRRRRGRAAVGWAVAAGVVGLFLADPLGYALRDLRLPDDFDQLGQFGVVADDAAADAAELESVLLETAARLGLDDRPGYVGSRERCHLPGNSVGVYVEFAPHKYYGATNDPAASMQLVSEYWGSLGYSVGQVTERPSVGGPVFSLGVSTLSGGSINVEISPLSTTLDGNSGCSATDAEAP